MFNNRFTSSNLINANSFFVNDFESTKVIELMNLPSEGAPIDYNDTSDTNSSCAIYDKLEFDENLVNIYMKIIDLIINTYEIDIFNDIALNFVNTFVDNLTKIKLVINSLPEYNDLKKIFNTVGDECIKVDYHDPNIVNNLDKNGQRNEYLRVIKK